MTADEIAELSSQIADIRRQTLRPLLDQIGAELEIQMRLVGFDFPVSLNIGSGTTILSIMTPADPPPVEFDQAADILCAILSKHLGGTSIDHREVSCSISKPVAAEITTTAD